MKKVTITPLVFLFLLPSLLLAFPSPSLAVVEAGVGLGITSFQEDLEDVDTDLGSSLEVNIGSGTMRLMFAMQSSDHDEGEYSAWMVGPSWTFSDMGFIPRIYALISGHEFERLDGYGVTAGGGVGWPLFPSATLGFDVRVSRWEGDGADVQTGTLQVLFRLGF